MIYQFSMGIIYFGIKQGYIYYGIKQGFSRLEYYYGIKQGFYFKYGNLVYRIGKLKQKTMTFSAPIVRI